MSERSGFLKPRTVAALGDVDIEEGLNIDEMINPENKSIAADCLIDGAAKRLTSGNLSVDNMSYVGWTLAALLGTLAVLREEKSLLAGLGAAATLSQQMGGYAYDRKKTERDIDVQYKLHEQQKRMSTKMHLIQLKAGLHQNDEQLENDVRLASKESQRYDCINDIVKSIIYMYIADLIKQVMLHMYFTGICMMHRIRSCKLLSLHRP